MMRDSTPGPGESYSMVPRKILLLILVSALSLVPILQAAHALTHVGETEAADMFHADGFQEESGPDADEGLDRICLDCLALAGVGIIPVALVVFFSAQTRRQPLPFLTSEAVLLGFSFPYLTRGPPRV